MLSMSDSLRPLIMSVRGTPAADVVVYENSMRRCSDRLVDFVVQVVGRMYPLRSDPLCVIHMRVILN